MKKILLLILVALTASASYAQHLNGTWHGDLQIGQQSLDIIFHFDKDVQNRCSGKMDIPKQSVRGIPVDILLLTNDSVSLQIPSINVSYTGRSDKGVIKGTFRQYGISLPLHLVAGTPGKPNRPQEPREPFGYQTEEISFTNSAANATLSGTLTYPVGYTSGKPVPVVLMVTGSGAQDRNEEIFEHKPFLVIADYLARHGIASLRYDDRGTGKSTGNHAECTSKDFAEDAKAGLAWLKDSKLFDKVGLLGHSEGGLIAFMIGAEKKADFIVSLAGTGIRGDSLLAEQQNAILRSYGQPANQTVERVRQEISALPQNPWMNFFLDYDPAPAIRRIDIPVMAINGSNDIQVISTSNLGAIQRLLANGNKKNFIKEYPGLNHLFQHCQPDRALDYYGIEETCSPEVLKDITLWINNL